MSSVVPLFLAALVQALGEAGVTSGVEAPWAVPFLAALPYLVAAGAQRAASRGDFRVAERWGRFVRGSGVLGFAGAVLGFGWVTTIERWTGARFDALAWPEPAILLALGPFFVFQVLALHAEVRTHAPRGLARRRLVGFQLRGFALVLVPVLIYLAVSWAVGAHPVARAWLEHVGLAQGLFAAALIALVAWLLPYALRRIWDTQPVPPGAQRQLLEVVAARARFRPAEWLVWRTGGSIANAAVVGFMPWGRLVLFTDDLLATLRPRELVAVVGHEIGHARRRHAWILLAWALALVLGVDLALTAYLERFAGPGIGAGVWVSLALALACLALGGLGFGWLSRRLELDADLFCAELTGDSAALASALRQVDGGWERDSWRHFASSRRVQFLIDALAAPDMARRFKRRIVTFGVLGGALAGATLVAEARGLAARLPVERVDAALALGRFAHATALSERLAPNVLDVDEQAELSAVLRVAREVGEGASAAQFEARLDAELAALAALDVTRAPDVAERLTRAYASAALATQRGRVDLGGLADALRAARRGDEAGVERSLATVAEATRALHGTWLARAAARMAAPQ